MQRFEYQILLLFILILVIGCSDNKVTEQTLMLSISTDNGNYQISNYKVLDRSFKKSNQQGNFQAHLLDQERRKLGEITFQKMVSSDAENADTELSVLLPMFEELHQVIIYQLDGSSGHYQLPEDPLATWKLPDSVKVKSKVIN